MRSSDWSSDVCSSDLYGTERSKRPVEISANPLWGESASRTRAASISPQRRHLDLEFHLRLDQRAHEASCCRPDISEYFSQHWPDGIPVDHVGDILGRTHPVGDLETSFSPRLHNNGQRIICWVPHNFRPRSD